MNNAITFVGYIELLARLWATGTTSLQKIRGFLQAEGVTEAEFNALEVRHEAAIKRREDEHTKTS